MSHNNRLKEIVSQLGFVLDAAPDAICVQDPDGRNLFTNEAYGKMIRRGSTEMVADAREIREGGETVGKIVAYHDISDINRLKRELDRLNQKLRKVQTRYTFKDIIGKDPALQKVIETARVASMTPATIMLRGESGTGKEIFANAIHNNSPRRNEKFVKINCSSLPEELLESELFGYKEGAFTGALRGGRKGLFQEADKGTLFMDEVGDVSPRMQVKLLRVLQEKEIMPVGSTEAVRVDVRIICATNRPLEAMVEAGGFREDLYYRLNVFPLYIPPLRERKEDIGLIVRYLLHQYNEFYGRQVEEVDEAAVQLLQMEDWKGNVRELENVLSRAFINMDPAETRLRQNDIAQALSGENGRPKAPAGGSAQAPDNVRSENAFDVPEDINEAVAQVEQFCIRRALNQCGGDKNRAAAALGLPLRTLYYKCKKYDL